MEVPCAVLDWVCGFGFWQFCKCRDFMNGSFLCSARLSMHWIHFDWVYMHWIHLRIIFPELWSHFAVCQCDLPLHFLEVWPRRNLPKEEATLMTMNSQLRILRIWTRWNDWHWSNLQAVKFWELVTSNMMKEAFWILLFDFQEFVN